MSSIRPNRVSLWREAFLSDTGKLEDNEAILWEYLRAILEDMLFMAAQRHYCSTTKYCILTHYSAQSFRLNIRPYT